MTQETLRGHAAPHVLMAARRHMGPVPHDASRCCRPSHLYISSTILSTDIFHKSLGLLLTPSSTILQRAREEEIEERKAMRRHERDVARKREFVRRVRVQIEERRAEVGGCPGAQFKLVPTWAVLVATICGNGPGSR